MATARIRVDRSNSTLGISRQAIPDFFLKHDDDTQPDKNGRKYNPEVVNFIRQDWIHNKLLEREGEYTRFETSSIYVGTWNVNGKKCPEDKTGLEKWLLGPGGASEPKLHDIFVIGLQEMVPLTASNVVMASAFKEGGMEEKKRAKNWDENLQAILNSTGETYYLIGSQHLVGVHMCVFVRSSRFKFVRNVAVSKAEVGIGGVLGNKGGVAVRFRFFDSTLCFVCSHLAAHRKAVSSRNANFHAIIEKLTMSHNRQEQSNIHEYSAAAVPAVAAAAAAATDEGGDGATAPGVAKQQQISGVLDHDHVIWLGDLNYRITADLTPLEVYGFIKKNDLGTLRAKDQLNIERAAGRVFEGFNEGELKFQPTYKYHADGHEYAVQPELKKIRAPAWCDRILWRSRPLRSRASSLVELSGASEAPCVLEEYNRAELLMSDHKPVHARLKLQLKSTMKHMKKNILKKITQQLNKLENKMIPKCELSSLEHHFDAVRYKVPARIRLTLNNTGVSLAQFRFIPKHDEPEFCKQWLSVSPVWGLLTPGESVDITLTTFVDERSVRDLSCGRDTMDDILILRIENGADKFMSVTGTFLPTCMGLSLASLVKCHTSVRKAKAEAAAKAKAAKASPTAKADNKPDMLLPKELWRLCDYIFTKCDLGTAGLLQDPGDKTEMQQITECLDTGAPFGTYSVHAVMGVLLDFLHCLREPVVPLRLCPDTDFDEARMKEWCRYFLKQLPPVNHNVFVYLLSFMREILTHSKGNQLDPSTLSLAFAPRLLHIDGSQSAQQYSHFHSVLRFFLVYSKQPQS